MLKNMKKSTKSNLITLGIVVGFYILIQILGAAGALTNSFSGQLVPICAYVILAVSLNLTVGMLGELSLGHAGFMSVGAFSGTLIYVVLADSAPKPVAMLAAFVVGGIVAGLFGVVVGIPVLRLSGDYLAIVTLAFGEIIKNVMNACYLGLDSHGLHFSLKDASSLNMDADGKVLINGTPCLRFKICRENPQTGGNENSGDYYLSSDRRHIYRLNVETNEVEEVDLSAP